MDETTSINKLANAAGKAHARARQYVLLPSTATVYPQWRTLACGPRFFLHHDPRLHVAERDGLLLLGSVYDLALDTMDLDAILADVGSYVADEARLHERLSDLAGRWTFAWHSQGALKIVADAAGLLPVFYHDSETLPLVSCNPELAAELAGAPVSEAGRARMAELSYRSETPMELSRSQRHGHDNWWPGELTPYRDIRHLLPNHCLELPGCGVARFWPSRPLPRRNLHSAARDASRLLAAIVAGVGKSRRNILMPISAGLDTRTLLAVSRNVMQRFSYFVYAPAVHQANDPFIEDQRIAGQLAQRHRLPLTELRYPTSLDGDFAERLASNMSFITASPTIAFEAQSIARTFGPDVTLLNGNVSEIARNFYGFMPRSLVDENYLTSAMDADLSPLTRAQIRKWLPGARLACDRGHIELSDLLYWEFRMGCWQAYVQVQLGGLLEIFTPYNCRRLLEILLGAPNGARSGVLAPLYREIIAQRWPELLQIPINPSKSRSYRVRAAAFVRRHDLLNFGTKSIWYRYKGWRQRAQASRVSA